MIYGSVIFYSSLIFQLSGAGTDNEQRVLQIMAGIPTLRRPQAILLAIATASGLFAAIMVGAACGCSDEGAAGSDDPSFSYQVQRFLRGVKNSLLHGE